MNIHFQKNKLVEDRLDWAKKAEREFLKTLKDHTIISLFKNKEKGESNTIVYGRSQVGKTSLILKLLDIRHEYYVEVSKVLRGGRSFGESSTIVPLLYGRSDCNKYKVICQNNTVEFEDSNEVESFFVGIREKVTQNGIKVADSVELKLPKIFFEDSPNSRKINIIDLPGVDSSDDSEWELVNEMYARYLPISNAVLIVEEINQIVHLNRLQDFGIVNWKQLPEKFKIVLTRAVSSNSTLKKLKKNKVHSKSNFLGIFKEELIRTLEISDMNLESIFPVEYGDSFENLKSNHSEIYDDIKIIIDQILIDLMKSIQESDTEYNQFRINSKVHLIYKERREERLAQYSRQMLEIENKKKNQESNLKSIQKNYEVIFEQLKVYKSYASIVDKCISNINILPRLITPKAFIEENGGHKNQIDQFKHLLKQYENYIKKPWIQLLGNNEINIFKMLATDLGIIRHDLPQASKCIKSVESLRASIENSIDTMYTPINQINLINFIFKEEKYLNIAENNVYDRSISINNDLNDALNELNTLKSDINSTMNNISRAIVKNQVLSNDTEKKIKDYDTRKETIKISMESYKKQSEDDYNKSRNYLNILNRAFKDERQEIIRLLSLRISPLLATSLLEKMYFMDNDWSIIKEHLDNG